VLLITGGTGFVGSAIVRKALDKGLNIRLLIHRQQRREFFHHPQISLCWGDILDPESLTPALEGVDIVINLVGIILEPRGISFEQVHYIGVKNLLEAAKGAGIRRFIHMSALGSSIRAASRYHQTKGRAEEYLKTSGIDYTIFRPSIIFGPEDQFINWFCRLIRYSPFIPIVGPGTNKLQPIYVEDVAEAFLKACEDPKTIGRCYDLGGPDPVTMNQLIDLLLRLLNKRRVKIHLPIGLMRFNAYLMEKVLPKPPITRDQLLMLQQDNTCDIGPLREELEIDPVPLEEGLRGYLQMA